MAIDAEVARALMARAVECLTRREYSQQELRQKLQQIPGATAEDVQAALELLKTKGYLSDERYAEGRIRMRSARYGNRRLTLELRQKGVPAEVIESVLHEAGDELGRVRAIWHQKFGYPPRNLKEKAKQYRFLAARGFSFDDIAKVVPDINDRESEEIEG